MKIKLLNDLDYGMAGIVEAGTVLEVAGEYAQGECWHARLGDRALIVPKKDARALPEQAPQ